MSLFLMKGHPADLNKVSLIGYYLSEKLDGIRCWWDGGITRGMLASDVPWANTAKDHIKINTVFATGLWTNYGKPIQAPNEWLNQLPFMSLDGELYIDRGMFQETSSIVRSLNAGMDRWSKIKFRVFDSPSYQSVLRDRQVTVGTIFKKKLSGAAFWAECKYKGPCRPPRIFDTVYHELKNDPNVSSLLVDQIRLPVQRSAALEIVRSELERIESLGGEGVVLRKGPAIWEPERVNTILKIKSWQDAEATVIGYRWGTNRLSGMMGSIKVVGSDGKVFYVSGIDDSCRVMTPLVDNPTSPRDGEDCPSDWTNKVFPRGTVIGYRFRELTNDGLPKEARYWRAYDSVRDT